MKRVLCVLALVALLAVGACSSDTGSSGPSAAAAVLTVNVEDAAVDVAVETLVTVEVAGGELDSASLTAADGSEIGGEGSTTAWTAIARLEPGTTYTLSASATGEDGEQATTSRTFTTRQLSLDEQTYPSVAPLAGETVGVGMPVIVYFDVPVTDRASFEANMHVSAEPAQSGSWYWISDREAHYRPQEFWASGSRVHVDLRLNSVPAGNGIYGQTDQVLDFQVGPAVVSTVDTAAHTMSVSIDGQVARTIPVSTGEPQFASRNGTKIVMEKFETVDMDAATTGVDSTDPNYYNIAGVRWAMRLTNSGEFVHAAPWSAAHHGRANVSHGCVGMSTEDAAWLYQNSRRGDVVVFTNSDRRLEPHNGWTDWNVSWEEWQRGSALASSTAPEPR